MPNPPAFSRPGSNRSRANSGLISDDDRSEGPGEVVRDAVEHGQFEGAAGSGVVTLRGGKNVLRDGFRSGEAIGIMNSLAQNHPTSDFGFNWDFRMNPTSSKGSNPCSPNSTPINPFR